MLTLRAMGRGSVHVRTSCTTPGLERADLLLQFLNVNDGLLEDLKLKFLLLTLLVLSGLFRVPGELVVVVIIVVVIVRAFIGGSD
jgi:hypothetical protein